MATRIPYLDEVWNVTTGCGDDMVSPGCQNCYARRMFGRNLWKCPECEGEGLVWRDLDVPGLKSHEYCPRCHGTGKATFAPTFHADRLDQPLHWRKPRVVGVSFMGDLFHEAITDTQIRDVIDRAIMAAQHTFVILTKRPSRMASFMRWYYSQTKGLLPNLHAGVTVCNQEEADRNISLLLDTPAAVRWVSLEPMLGAVDLRPGLYEEGFDPKYGPLGPTGPGPFLDWVVLGGETGPGARPMQPEWALDVYRQCKAAGVAFWFKSWGRDHPFHIPGPDRYTQAEYGGMLDLEATHELPAALAEAVRT